MFNPSQAEGRRSGHCGGRFPGSARRATHTGSFACGCGLSASGRPGAVHAKGAAGQPMDALETLAGQWLNEHPEYSPELADADAAVAKAFDGQDGANPFLHLSMHLSISEQCSIDQPRGIRQAIELLAARRSSLHDAHHEAMECLGQMLWESQRSGRPPNGAAYVECVQRRATQD